MNIDPTAMPSINCQKITYCAILKNFKKRKKFKVDKNCFGTLQTDVSIASTVVFSMAVSDSPAQQVSISHSSYLVFQKVRLL
jgi:hypothetical protein